MKLPQTQQRILDHAHELAAYTDHSYAVLVSGHQYRSAAALERKGLGTLKYQGPSLGWFRLPTAASTTGSSAR